MGRWAASSGWPGPAGTAGPAAVTGPWRRPSPPVDDRASCAWRARSDGRPGWAVEAPAGRWKPRLGGLAGGRAGGCVVRCDAPRRGSGSPGAVRGRPPGWRRPAATSPPRACPPGKRPARPGRPRRPPGPRHPTPGPAARRRTRPAVVPGHPPPAGERAALFVPVRAHRSLLPGGCRHAAGPLPTRRAAGTPARGASSVSRDWSCGTVRPASAAFGSARAVPRPGHPDDRQHQWMCRACWFSADRTPPRSRTTCEEKGITMRWNARRAAAGGLRARPRCRAGAGPGRTRPGRVQRRRTRDATRRLDHRRVQRARRVPDQPVAAAGRRRLHGRLRRLRVQRAGQPR